MGRVKKNRSPLPISVHKESGANTALRYAKVRVPHWLCIRVNKSKGITIFSLKQQALEIRKGGGKNPENVTFYTMLERTEGICLAKWLGLLLPKACTRQNINRRAFILNFANELQTQQDSMNLM